MTKRIEEMIHSIIFIKKKNSLNNKFLVSLSFSPTNNYVEQTRNPEKGEWWPALIPPFHPPPSNLLQEKDIIRNRWFIYRVSGRHIATFIRHWSIPQVAVTWPRTRVDHDHSTSRRYLTVFVDVCSFFFVRLTEWQTPRFEDRMVKWATVFADVSLIYPRCPTMDPCLADE